MQPKTIIKIYDRGIVGQRTRTKEERFLFDQGYNILQEEEIKEWSGGKACCLMLIFLPAVFFAKVKRIKVTYEYNNDVIHT